MAVICRNQGSDWLVRYRSWSRQSPDSGPTGRYSTIVTINESQIQILLVHPQIDFISSPLQLPSPKARVIQPAWPPTWKKQPERKPLHATRGHRLAVSPYIHPSRSLLNGRCPNFRFSRQLIGPGKVSSVRPHHMRHALFWSHGPVAQLILTPVPGFCLQGQVGRDWLWLNPALKLQGRKVPLSQRPWQWQGVVLADEFTLPGSFSSLLITQNSRRYDVEKYGCRRACPD